MIELIEDALMSNESIIKFDQVEEDEMPFDDKHNYSCLLYTSPSPRDATLSRMPSSA